MKKNIAKKLREMQFSKDVKNEIIADIFGKRRGDAFECGLMDAKSEEGFDAMLDNLEQRSSSIHVNGADFHAWFRARKKRISLFSHQSGPPKRAGLGSPPESFITSRSE